jgi:ubiquinone/menaquinone biosynthesis C-methylase UbiE
VAREEGERRGADEERIARFNAAQRETFDRCYDRFLVELAPDVVERMQRIVAAPSIAPGEVVLDVGTGTGALIPLIQRHRPGQVVACDLSARMLEQVARRFPDVACHQCDVRDLALPDGSLDVVFMNGMFGNIVDKVGAMTNLVRMLRPRGRVVISHPEGRGFVARIAQTEPFPITPLPSEAEAHAFLGSFGLSVQQYVDEEKLLIVVAATS